MNCQEVNEVIKRTLKARREDRESGVPIRGLEELTTLGERNTMRHHVQGCRSCLDAMMGTIDEKIKNGTFDPKTYLEGVEQAQKDEQGNGNIDALAKALGHMIAVSVIHDGPEAFREKYLKETTHLSPKALGLIKYGLRALVEAGFSGTTVHSKTT